MPYPYYIEKEKKKIKEFNQGPGQIINSGGKKPDPGNLGPKSMFLTNS